MSADQHNRRRFISQSVKLALLGTLLPAVACNNQSKNKGKDTRDTTGKKPSARSKRNRKKWSHEGLVMNNKSHVMHLPSSKIYHYYDEIKPKHLQELAIAGWATHLQAPNRINRSQSGIILEIFCLRHLQPGLNNETLTAAMDTLGRAFSADCNNAKDVNMNERNFRLHELMLQLIALHPGVADKWQAFNARVKKPASLRKRQKWMENETAFGERVKYIQERQPEYTSRLQERARKYSFT
jgi:hypothetical protein